MISCSRGIVAAGNQVLVRMGVTHVLKREQLFIVGAKRVPALVQRCNPLRRRGRQVGLATLAVALTHRGWFHCLVIVTLRGRRNPIGKLVTTLLAAALS